MLRRFIPRFRPAIFRPSNFVRCVSTSVPRAAPLDERINHNGKITITLARGDGIGPEIMNSTLAIMDKAGANLTYEEIQIGEKLYLAGHSSGIAQESWDSIRKTKVLLKGPITTPFGGGYKSLNVTIRKTLGLYANVRPCIGYPFIATKHPNMDVVIVRENEEDLYAGIEHKQTDQVVQCLKLISRPGCERVINYAFEYASRNNRKKVTCFIKDNIMKLTDGLFAEVFQEVAARYPHIKTERMIIDIGAARLADTPEIFDVIVTSNLYGDIISDVAAQLTGSVGLGASANIGHSGAMFEAIHGSAPQIAGKDEANPSGLLLSAVQMLVHVGQPEVAEKIHNAWLATVEEGVHTPDIFNPKFSKVRVGNKDFAAAIIDRLGAKPKNVKAVTYDKAAPSMRGWNPLVSQTVPGKKELMGVDMFVQWNPANGSSNDLGEAMSKLNGDGLDLKLITNRGVKVWPNGFPETFCTDHWRCRFRAPNGKTVRSTQVLSLFMRANNAGFDVIKTENLYTINGKLGFSLAQGE